MLICSLYCKKESQSKIKKKKKKKKTGALKSILCQHEKVDYFIQVWFCFFRFWPPHGLWSFQARDQIWASAATYTTAVATPDPLTHCARLGIEPVSWHRRGATNPVAPQWAPVVICFCFCFMAATAASRSSQSQGLNLNCSYDLHCSYGNTRSF